MTALDRYLAREILPPFTTNLLFLTQTYPRFAGDTAGPFIRDLALGLGLDQRGGLGFQLVVRQHS